MLRKHSGDLKTTMMLDRMLLTKETIHESDCMMGVSLIKA